MKKLLALLGIFGFMLFITSCGEEEVIEEVTEVEKFVDDPNAEETAADTSSTGVYQEEVSEEPQSLQEAMSATDEIKQEEGGRSFCDCVKRNKELEDIMMGDNTTDEDFDKAMAEMEEMKTNDCKIMFPDQSNVEEVAAHKRKVKNCLK